VGSLDTARGDSSRNLGNTAMKLVLIKEFVYQTLPKNCQKILLDTVLKKRDERSRGKELNKETQETSPSFDAVSLPWSNQLNSLSLLQPVYSNESFLSVASEVINELFINVLQNELRDNSVINSYVSHERE
jgi:hypothetical protein